MLKIGQSVFSGSWKGVDVLKIGHNEFSGSAIPAPKRRLQALDRSSRRASKMIAPFPPAVSSGAEERPSLRACTGGSKAPDRKLTVADFQHKGGLIPARKLTVADFQHIPRGRDVELEPQAEAAPKPIGSDRTLHAFGTFVRLQ